MYKRASRRTGGSQLNCRARIAAPPNNAKIERGAAHSPFVRQMILAFGDGSDGQISSLKDFDLALLTLKILDGYSMDRSIASIGGRLDRGLTRDGTRIRLSTRDRQKLETTIPKILQRWQTYRRD